MKEHPEPDARGRRSVIAGGTLLALAGVPARFATTVQPTYDSHMHLASDNVARFPPAPVDGIFHPQMLTDSNTAERFAKIVRGEGVVRACAVHHAHLYSYTYWAVTCRR